MQQQQQSGGRNSGSKKKNKKGKQDGGKGGGKDDQTVSTTPEKSGIEPTEQVQDEERRITSPSADKKETKGKPQPSPSASAPAGPVANGTASGPAVGPATANGHTSTSPPRESSKDAPGSVTSHDSKQSTQKSASRGGSKPSSEPRSRAPPESAHASKQHSGSPTESDGSTPIQPAFTVIRDNADQGTDRTDSDLDVSVQPSVAPSAGPASKQASKDVAGAFGGGGSVGSSGAIGQLRAGTSAASSSSNRGAVETQKQVGSPTVTTAGGAGSQAPANRDPATASSGEEADYHVVQLPTGGEEQMAPEMHKAAGAPGTPSATSPGPASPQPISGMSSISEPSFPPGAGYIGKKRIWRQSLGKYARETDEDKRWFRHRNHVFVFTFSGKPVYTRYGNDEDISQFGVLQVVASKMAAFFHHSAGKDVLRSITTTQRRFVFLEKGPLILVCITGHLALAHTALETLLSRVYRQFVTIVTSGVEKTLMERPNLDIRNLLAGTQHVIGNLVRWSFNDMLLQVEGIEPLPLDPAHRNVCTEALRSTRIKNLLLACIIAGHRVVSLVTNRQTKATYQVGDLVCVINYILSSNSLRGTESWTPICLPSISDRAFTYAYIGYVPKSDVCQIFLSYDNAGPQFMDISKAARRITQQLRDTQVLNAIEEAAAACPVTIQYQPGKRLGFLSNSFQGQLGWLLDNVIHGCYYLEATQQYFSSAVKPPYEGKYIFRNYSKCTQLMMHCALPSQICVATDSECFYVWLQPEFRMFLTVPRGISTSVIGQFYQWIQAQELFIFLGNTPTW
eukprot:g105.t1